MGVVLTRRVGESVVIGRCIVVTAISNGGRGSGQVRLLIEAAKDIPIERLEVVAATAPEVLTYIQAGSNHCQRCGQTIEPLRCRCLGDA